MVSCHKGINGKKKGLGLGCKNKCKYRLRAYIGLKEGLGRVNEWQGKVL